MKKIKTILPALGIIFLMYWILNYNLYNIMDIQEQFYIGTLQKIMLSGLLAYYFYKIVTSDNIFLFKVILFTFGIFWTIQMPVFSLVDEGAHFAYINFICDNNRLPLVTDIIDITLLEKVKATKETISSGMMMYEAVHPPVYYIITAMLCKLFDSVEIRFWICRIIGIVILVLISDIIFLWCKYLNQIGLINDKQKQRLLMCSMVILCMPGVLTRFGTVSNEGLAVLFVTLILYQITKVIFDARGVHQKNIILITVLIILAVLTKVTTAFVIVLWILVLLYYKKYKVSIVSCMAIIGAIVPWLLFNFIHYGNITATEAHLSFVLPIINPNKEMIDIISGITNIFYFFFYPQEGIVSEITKPMVYFLSIFLLLIFILFLKRSIKNLYTFTLYNKCCFDYSLKEKNLFIELIYSFCILGNMIILILGSISTYVSIMLGRYLYLSCIPIIYFIFLYIEEIQQEKIYKIFTFVLCVLCLENSLTYLSPSLSNIVGSKCEYENIDIMNITSYDVLMENGVFLSGVIDPQITFLDELEEEYQAIEFEVEVINNLVDTFVMYYAVNGVFSEENKIISYYNEANQKVRFIFQEKEKITNIRLDPPNGSSITIKGVKLFK